MVGLMWGNTVVLGEEAGWKYGIKLGSGFYLY